MGSQIRNFGVRRYSYEIPKMTMRELTDIRNVVKMKNRTNMVANMIAVDAYYVVIVPFFLGFFTGLVKISVC